MCSVLYNFPGCTGLKSTSSKENTEIFSSYHHVGYLGNNLMERENFTIIPDRGDHTELILIESC